MDPLFESKWAAVSWGIGWVFMFISVHQMYIWNMGFSCGAMILMVAFQQLSTHIESEYQTRRNPNVN